jgi:hypothetical protein
MASITSSVGALHGPSQTRLLIAGRTVPWYIWCALLAITSATIGGIWDISWHMSIGRDTFWTPAHMAIYLCGVLAGIAFSYIILTTTFSSNSPLKEASVHIWGLRAPLGAFIAAWGGLAMLTSAPFDNWWHNAYGLDVEIVSPPHILLFFGIYGILLGTMTLIAGHMNRATGSARQRCRFLFIYGMGIALTMAMTMLMDYVERPFLHSSQPYLVLSIFAPVMLTVASRATGARFAATACAGIYTFIYLAFMLILPLFPAQPKLGPVYQPVTHFIPLGFPVLLLAPALALDLLWQRTKEWPLWKLAGVSGLVFLGVLMAVEWPFANFLMSPPARNRFFGSGYFWYGLPPTSHLARNIFWTRETSEHFWISLALALFFCCLSSRFALSRGESLRTIKR